MKTSHLKLLPIGAILVIVVLGSVYLFARSPESPPLTVASPAAVLTSSVSASPSITAAISPLISAAVVPGASGAPTLAPTPATSTQPKITWSTTSIEVILSPGESTSKDLTFTSSLKLSNIVVEPVTTIAPFVSIQPNSFVTVPAGQPQSVHVSIAIPTGSALGTYNGTIHLRSGSITYPDTVKPFITVWQALTVNEVGLSFKVPAFNSPTHIDVTGDSNGRTLVTLQLQDPATSQLSSVFTFIVRHGSALGLREWFRQYVDINDILTNQGTFVEQRMPSGSLALVAVGPIPDEYLTIGGPLEDAYLSSPTGDTIVSIAQSQENILFTLGYSQDAISSLLINVLGTVRFE